MSRLLEAVGKKASNVSSVTASIAGIGESSPDQASANCSTYLDCRPPATHGHIVTPNIGVTYSGSGKKLAEHGGFSHDDTNVMMLLCHPGFSPNTVTSPVETAQIAPTVLSALGLDPNALQSVQQEHTQLLPGIPTRRRARRARRTGISPYR